jgi:dihydrofolate reductase
MALSERRSTRIRRRIVTCSTTRTMGMVTCQISISLDGFVAGPNQSLDNPLGEGGMRLHDWLFATETWQQRYGEGPGEKSPDSEVAHELMQGVGAYIMGRNMFGGGPGPWDMAWHGWWGDDPPYHTPVFVLTHHPREPLPMEGGTTFHFVTDGPESALEQAQAAAGEKPVSIAGGASTVRQYLAAGKLDELYLHIAPIVLGAGERLFEDVGDPILQPVKVIASPRVTHIKYRIAKGK